MAATGAAFASQKIPVWARTAGRAVHVKIYPQPRNLSESREILRVLQQYGEVVMYKHLKHEPNLHAANTALAIYQKTNDAQTIINASPLRFELGHAEASAPVSRLQHWDPPLTAENQGQIDGGGSIEREDTIDGQEEPHEVDHVQQRPDEATSKSSTALGGKAKWGALRTSLIQHQATATVTATATAPAPAPAPATASPSSEAQLQNFTPNPPPVTGSAKDISQTLPPSEPSREFHLIIERSVLNHHAYIQRQHYYAGFQLDLKNTMADDLRARVPVPGMADCQLMKGDAPLRLRNKKKQDEEAQPWKSLGQLWREGLRSEDGNGINDKVGGSAVRKARSLSRDLKQDSEQDRKGSSSNTPDRTRPPTRSSH